MLSKYLYSRIKDDCGNISLYQGKKRVSSAAAARLMECALFLRIKTFTETFCRNSYIQVFLDCWYMILPVLFMEGLFSHMIN